MIQCVLKEPRDSRLAPCQPLAQRFERCGCGVLSRRAESFGQARADFGVGQGSGNDGVPLRFAEETRGVFGHGNFNFVLAASGRGPQSGLIAERGEGFDIAPVLRASPSRRAHASWF